MKPTRRSVTAAYDSRMLRLSSRARGSARTLLLGAIVWTLVTSGCASHDQLKEAIDAGDAARAEALVRKEASPDFYVTEWLNVHLTPLMFAAYRGKVDVVNRLLAAGADPNFGNEDGWTALTVACFQRHPEIVRVLLARGADAVRAGRTGESCRMVLHRLKEKDPREAQIVGILADAKVPLDLRLKRPPGWARGGNTLLDELMADGKLDVIEAYLAHGTPVDARDESGATLLMSAIAAKRLDFARLLLAKGADPSVKDAQGRDALAVARATLTKRNAAVLEAALDPSLSSPDERIAAYDRADAERLKLEEADQRELAAKQAEIQRAYSAKVQAEARQREELERRQEAARRSQEAASSRSSAPEPALDPICETPEMRACRQGGRRSCSECFHAMLKANGRGSGGGTSGSSLSCPAKSKPCGGVCCGTGYVCCVGVTSVNTGQEACRLSSRGCNQGWDAERVK